MVCALRTGNQQIQATTRNGLARINVVQRFAEVFGIRMIGGMGLNGTIPVIYSD